MDGAILGISAFYHDSAAVLIRGDDILAAAHEERFSRRKHDARFPANAVGYVLAESGLKIDDLDAVAFYDKPYLKFERLLETYHAFAPKGLKSFISAMPVWVKEKLFMRQILWEELEKAAGSQIKRRPPLLFPEHHLSHAASAFYPSPYRQAAVLTLDGVGEWATATIGVGNDGSINILRELNFPHSIGLLYSTVTYYCGFKVNSGEYKLMGLAPYGDRNGSRFKKFKKTILEHLVDMRDDGSILLNLQYFDYPTGLRMCSDEKWHNLFGVPRRKPETKLTGAYMDLALAIQEVTEDVILRLARTAKTLTGCNNLAMAGGVALNCVANGKLLREKIFENIWIQPAAGDAGGALGAAYAARYIWQGATRTICNNLNDAMQGAYLGPEFDARQIQRLAGRFDAPYRWYQNYCQLCKDTAALLSDGNVIGWFQGRMELGPRALGNRSILGDPRHPEMQKRLNIKIKFREGFRPFAPSVLAEDAAKYFELDYPSPYMLLVALVQKNIRKPLPQNYETMDLYDRLYHLRSEIPAVTHVDYSARIQTVHQETNPRYWQLIKAFKALTDCAVIVNTSFNVRGEPIVCTPEDAYRCFMRTDMDYLVMGDFLFAKTQQPEWKEEGDWRKQYVLD